MRIVHVEPGKAPYEKEIDNTLDAIQTEVGGAFEIVYMDDGVLLCCNEEGKLRGMTPNRRIGRNIICGPFFLVGADGDDFCSLTDEQASKYMERFRAPEQFAEHEPAAQPFAMIFGFDFRGDT